MDERIKKILLEKPDLISDFPSWMLPSEEIEKMRKTQDIVILEVAGRDSFAALFKYMENNTVKGILPTIAYTATEYGPWECLYDNLDYMKDHLSTLSVNIFTPVVMGAPSLWKKLCGSITTKSIQKFGFYTPCIGCHLYLHAIRIPLALLIGAKAVIAGERESHNGMLKINQLRVSLEGYLSLYKKFDLSLEMPIRYVKQSSDIEKILGVPWDRGKRQLECVLSGNYVDENGNVTYDEDAIKKYLNDFAIPLIENYIRKNISN